MMIYTLFVFGCSVFKKKVQMMLYVIGFLRPPI